MPESLGLTIPSPVKRRNENEPGSDKKIMNDDNRDDVLQRTSIIKDEQVLVNLAMADLMAYLQVVANNSNNLPLTRRDDPELTRMVTNLTSEEYARKSAAFIPADVRVIAGSFLKYGNVWDLPTSEEYVASDGAQEPGRSYGGACCNNMLKVLYDAASEADGAVHDDEQACDALFDDDDDESLSTLPFTRNNTFASLDMNGQSNPSTITWAEVLRKMKTEINDIEYVQAPMIGATRKFDLNQPFSLVPESFDKGTGKKRSLLIGCNYNDTEGAELKASHDDVCSMKDYIVNVHGFSETEDMMTVLLDDTEHSPPTFVNIVEAFKSLSEQSQPGDAVFIQFSGHGGRILDSPINNNVESYDEIIVPSDYSASGVIRDTLIFKTLLAPMRYGVSVTIVIDSCDTGMMLDLPYSWSTRYDKLSSVAKMKQNENFSFVRFLKVVKTLYESSTFTQLGRTVGTALGEQPAGNESTDEEDHEEEAAKGQNDLPIEPSRTEDLQESSVLGMCSPKGQGGVSDPFSIIEKMLGCNFLVHDLDDDFSDGETFANNTYNTFDDTHTMAGASTFDSISDGEYTRAANRRRKSRKNKR
eukprot:CAMPEP_0168182418 /NCGR_PEP_ID=MMETSP0139_2-20121125/11884_1 /TAXON_ID=44445 /ORGANISM="Pseudo-nitzschia australis, Strain 10249 10 AB" /LENGTH=585 /DNA_ID=CAMNT_0008103349 /DNA_START=286 /DNA_END=2043 /DNA_ORIENTATION=+